MTGSKHSPPAPIDSGIGAGAVHPMVTNAISTVRDADCIVFECEVDIVHAIGADGVSFLDEQIDIGGHGTLPFLICEAMGQ